MISVEEALARITGAFMPLPTEQVGLENALGRVLAADISARLSQPPSDVSAMDGYAVRAEDVAALPIQLRCIGEAPAGHAYAGHVSRGEALRIFTGAPVPEGADTIVIQEDTERDDDTVTVRDAGPPGRFIRPAGLDFQEGQVLLKAGHRLTARDVGLAAAMDVPWLSVRRRPRVAILATGDEVVMPGDPRGPNQVVSSNSHALAAFVTANGGLPINLGIALDDADSLRTMAASARGADVLVTTGGASVGDHDLVRQVLGKVGLEIDFWRIAMRPGKPVIFGRIGETAMLGLPGNPVSTVVCATVYLRPALETLLGLDATERSETRARLGRDLPENDRRQDYLRSALERADDGALVATPFERQDSSMLSLLASAKCLVVRPPFAPPAQTGEMVEILTLSGGVLSI